ncbi:MAG: sulfate permease [Acidimicrobiia bacterium]|nr:sulfate permease [Acidimicrobiia bacterium]
MWSQKVFPCTRWLGAYRRRWFVPDAVAGLVVWALIVPESMAYAAIAGVPVQFGLYSVPIAILGYAMFGTSRRLFVGPSSTVASLSAATVAPLAATGSTNYIALTAALAILVGVLYIVLGLLRMGFIARFFAKPVLDGFIVGLGLYIAVGQLYKVFGAPKPSGNTVQQFWDVLTSIDEWNSTTTIVGLASLALLFGLSKYAPKVPGALVVVVLGIAATSAFDLASHGVAIVGTVPTGFHFVSWSGVSVDDLWEMIPGALGIIVVGFAQSIAIAKAYAAEDNEPIDPSGEMIGYGAASIGSGVLQGYTPTGSLSKSAAAEEAGAKTPVAFLVTAAFVVLTIFFLAGVFEDLPEAVLGAIVIHAVSGMIDFRKLTRLWRAHVADFWLALGALLGVILIGILAGIVVGVVLSLVLLIHRLDHPHVAILGTSEDGKRFEDVAEHPDASPDPGILVYRLDAPLIFANADVVAEDVVARIDQAVTPIRAVVLDLEAVYEVDTQGADTLVHLSEQLQRRDVRVVIARAHVAVIEYMQRDGSLAKLGDGAVWTSVDEAVIAVRPST